MGLPGNLGTALILVQTLATQLLIVVAILQWRAFDVDVVIRRSLLAGTVLVVGLGVYGVVVAIVSSTVGRDGGVPSLVGAAAVVLTVAPAALIARRVVDRAFYGRRGDPYAVVAELGRRASAASAPGEALDEIVEAITQELKLPYAAILDAEAVMLASSGTLASNDDCADLPLEHQGVAVGALRVGYRRGEDGLSAAEERLLSTLAHQVGASVRALQLVDGLKAAREQLVVAREDERRRIQRDLHDGLGPQLTAVTMHLDAARNHLAAGNPTDTDDLLRDARRELHQAGGDVRRLVYSLGDPSIASRGLPSAIDAQVRLLTQATGVHADIDLQPLPPLSAATEEAIHRIISEAVTNVVRHAQASTMHRGAVVRRRTCRGLHHRRRHRHPARRTAGRRHALVPRSSRGTGRHGHRSPRADRRDRSTDRAPDRTGMTNASDRPIRVVIADDHALIRAGVRALLGSFDNTELVGEAADGDEALRVVAETRPDVVIMDIHMPGLDGVSATRSIAADFPDVAVLVVSMLEDDASVFAAMRAGARGYLVKGDDPDELRRSIEAVAAGAVVFGPTLAARVQLLFQSKDGERSNDAFPGLTDREMEVLGHLADGKSNVAIGAAMYLSPRTIANHVSNILLKLHATDRTDAAFRARRAGLGESERT